MGKGEMQNDVLNIEPKKARPEIFPEGFNNSDDKGEMQNDVSNILVKKAPLQSFPERFNKIDVEGQKQIDVFNIQPKKALGHIFSKEIRNGSSMMKLSAYLLRFILLDPLRIVLSVGFTSDSTTAMTKICSLLIKNSPSESLRKWIGLVFYALYLVGWNPPECFCRFCHCSFV